VSFQTGDKSIYKRYTKNWAVGSRVKGGHLNAVSVLVFENKFCLHITLCPLLSYPPSLSFILLVVVLSAKDHPRALPGLPRTKKLNILTLTIDEDDVFLIIYF
jgi:hypothetical protein